MAAKIRGHVPEILLTCALLVGLAIMLYPFASDWWNTRHQTQAIAAYEQAVTENSTERNQELWDAAVAYNGELPHDAGRFTLTDEQRQRYEETLDVTGTGVMGYVEIPKISVRLPIYHGTDDTVLQVAIGHIPGSSLPVGGEGTHCVISGHRGLPSARLFSDIDRLQEGDLFTLNVLGKTLTYQVDQIRTVEPDDLSELAFDPGADLCTLVTCTPYGVNTHRLLVRGHRVPNEELASVDGEAERVNPAWEAAGMTAVVLALIAAGAGVRVGVRRLAVRHSAE